ncbi:16S rRNA (cytosine967-C5)-methyltransferase [Evansella caseinilytica]|uniref:16S rRNA (cytosine(967)-C(5))-methyltransferase n=1 Tax=Evansella caseinilytica TaxID=1503961 RepID=A0A1H3MC50_9BACI|nr:16S rRNA (cytosine(967)-C(5))-methyltransferase RsmB [Evansella caseinilytica]SDY74302.1 16S rRNA (cytosine967-C5)-methyltransferase [Evansella caseinilytica]
MAGSNVREATLDILLKIEQRQAYSNLLVNETIKKAGLPQKDVPLLTELVYGTLQRQLTLDFYLTPFSKRPLERLEKWVHLLLRLTLYQMIYLDRVPDRAAIHEAVEIAKKRGHKGIAGTVNGILRTIQRSDLPDIDALETEVDRLAVKTSHPQWLISRWVSQYGIRRTEQMAAANLQPPVLTARINTSKAAIDEVLASLQSAGVAATQSETIPECIEISKGSVIHTSAFKAGLLTIQDAGSMLVAYALAPEKQEVILDACAAPGGKSTHIAEKIADSGKIISLDIHPHKVHLIKQSAERLQLNSIETQVLDAREAGGHLERESFDRILVDAPCSGLGVIQRKPDIKWTKTAEDVRRLSKIQRSILDSVWPLLKKGGRLVYSTCTVDKEENQQVVEAFVSAKEDAVFDDRLAECLPAYYRDDCRSGMLQLFPGDKKTDGFFIATVLKTN